MLAQASAPARVRRIHLGSDGLTFDGVGINLGGLVLVCAAAVYAGFTDGRWWLPLVVLTLIPLVMGIA